MSIIYCTQCGQAIEIGEGGIEAAMVCPKCGEALGGAGAGEVAAAAGEVSAVRPQTCGLAIAALACGILGFVCLGVGPILGIIFACIAFGKIRSSQGRIKGKGLATAGLVVSIVFLLVQMAAMPLALFMPALGRARELAQQVQCAHNLHQIGNTIALYLNDFQEHAPPDLAILIETEGLDPDVLVCPLDFDGTSQDSYHYRGADLSGASPINMILAYESLENHLECRNVLFVGYNVAKMDESGFLEAIEEDNRMRREMGLEEKPIEW